MRRVWITLALDLAPLNVVMLVLVIFLLPQSSGEGECLHHPLPVKVPAAKNVLELCSSPVLTVAGNEVLLDGAETETPEGLADRLRTLAQIHPVLFEGAPLRRVLLHADRRTPYATLRPLLGVVSALGLDLDFVVEKSGGRWLLDPSPASTCR